MMKVKEYEKLKYEELSNVVDSIIGPVENKNKFKFSDNGEENELNINQLEQEIDDFVSVVQERKLNLSK